MTLEQYNGKVDVMPHRGRVDLTVTKEISHGGMMSNTHWFNSKEELDELIKLLQASSKIAWEQGKEDL